jgi:hypothetical protein
LHERLKKVIDWIKYKERTFNKNSDDFILSLDVEKGYKAIEEIEVKDLSKEGDSKIMIAI